MMTLSKFAQDEGYKKLIRDFELKPRTYKDIADDWKRNDKEWYLALIAIEDVSMVLDSIPQDLRVVPVQGRCERWLRSATSLACAGSLLGAQAGDAEKTSSSSRR